MCCGLGGERRALLEGAGKGVASGLGGIEEDFLVSQWLRSWVLRSESEVPDVWTPS